MNISLSQITLQIIMTLSNFYTNTISIFNDAPQPWQFGFQDSAAPAFTGLVTLHNTIGFYLIIISLAVFWVFFSLITSYESQYHPIAHKYLTHGTVLELIWTITPALILMFVAFPSFRLLYLMDFPIYGLIIFIYLL
jgi:cytochrome c oxidase subunit 2